MTCEPEVWDNYRDEYCRALHQNPKPTDVALIDRSKNPALEVSVAEITNQVHVFAQAMIDFGLTPVLELA